LKSTAVAYILLLLVGIFGGHKFYLGMWGWGLIYFLLFAGAGLLLKSVAGLVLFALLLILLLIDFFTLPKQVAKTSGPTPN
jgi:TM2 domain-containing membrane protein YozV